MSGWPALAAWAVNLTASRAMSNGQSSKIEVHPNLALFGATQSGTEAVVGTVVNGTWSSYFMCN